MLDAAQSLISDRGYQAMKMEDVADAAEVSKGTLYLYFQNKNDLCAAVATRAIDAFVVVLNDRVGAASSGRDAVGRLLQAYCDFGIEHPHVFRFVVSWLNANVRFDATTPDMQRYRQRVADTLNIAAQAIVRGQQDGSIRRDIDPALHGFHLWASLLGVVLTLVNRESIAQRIPHEVAFSEVLQVHIDAMTRALAPNASMSEELGVQSAREPQTPDGEAR